MIQQIIITLVKFNSTLVKVDSTLVNSLFWGYLLTNATCNLIFNINKLKAGIISYDMIQ